MAGVAVFFMVLPLFTEAGVVVWALMQLYQCKLFKTIDLTQPSCVPACRLATQHQAMAIDYLHFDNAWISFCKQSRQNISLPLEIGTQPIDGAETFQS